jgi:hypothetical protein
MRPSRAHSHTQVNIQKKRHEWNKSQTRFLRNIYYLDA